MADDKHEYVPTGGNRWPDTGLLNTRIKGAWQCISLWVEEKSQKVRHVKQPWLLDEQEDDFIWNSDDDRVSSADVGNDGE